MCRISKPAFDWVTKGFHLHVHGIEVVMRPDHKGGIVFKKWFRSDSDQDAHPAIKRAQELLHDIEWRRTFHREARRARDFLSEITGNLQQNAQGKCVELTYLLAALRKLGL
jgi:hypothetical protein